MADNTDVYAFVSPDRPDSVTLIANYIPLQDPAGGPNFFQFGDDVLYTIYVDNDGDGVEDISFDFRFRTEVRNPDTFLYNVGPIASLDDSNWNVRQFYDVSRWEYRNGHRSRSTALGRGLATPPVNIGPRSTPNYEALAAAAVHELDGGMRVFAGQREEAFNVDLGSIFDLGTLRPFQDLHLIPSAAAVARDGTKGFNVHAIALQVPMSALTRDGSTPGDVADPRSTIGVWAAASRQRNLLRQRGRDRDGDGLRDDLHLGPFVQVSRLGNPLINEVVIPLGKKDAWNSGHPSDDSQYAPHYAQPELAQLLPVLYPGVFPNLEALNASGAARADIMAILLTGIPGGLIPGFQNFTSETQADMLRLNMAIPPAASPNPIGLVAGDPAGFPNGRRIEDHVVAIELRALAGAVYGLIDPDFMPDGAAALLEDGTTNDVPMLGSFPYLGTPHQGYEHAHD